MNLLSLVELVSSAWSSLTTSRSLGNTASDNGQRKGDHSNNILFCLHNIDPNLRVDTKQQQTQSVSKVSQEVSNH